MVNIRKCKMSVAFATKTGLSSDNPKDWSEEQIKAYETFRSTQAVLDMKQRSRNSYQKKKDSGAVLYVPIAEQSAEDALRKRETNRRTAAIFRAKQQSGNAGLSKQGLRDKVYGNMKERDADLMKTGPPPKPKPERSPDADGKRKPEHLDAFLKAHPEVDRVRHVNELPRDTFNAYKHWRTEKLNVEDPGRVEARREYSQRYEAEHREERREKAQAYRVTGDSRSKYVCSQLRYKAKKRDIAFELSDEDVSTLIQKPCFYCGDDDGNMGVDAVHDHKGFVDGNVVPACGLCNRAKLCYSLDHFLRVMSNVGARASGATWTPDYAYDVRDATSSQRTYGNYLRGASERGLEFTLTEAQFRYLIGEPCAYCGCTRGVGIDRVDPAKGYHTSNTVSACWPCNRMKRDYTVDQFIGKTKQVLERLRAGVFDSL